jgi:hypothetical protein
MALVDMLMLSGLRRLMPGVLINVNNITSLVHERNQARITVNLSDGQSFGLMQKDYPEDFEFWKEMLQKIQAKNKLEIMR